MNECVLCLEKLDGLITELPGCGHKIHTHCMLTAAQYDVRCPLCRSVPLNVNLRQEVNESPSRVIETLHANYMNSRRRWQQKKSKLLSKRADLKSLNEKLKECRNNYVLSEKELEKVWNVKMKALWAGDNELKTLQANHAKTRNKHTRLLKRFNNKIEDIIGKCPEFLDEITFV